MGVKLVHPTDVKQVLHILSIYRDHANIESVIRYLVCVLSIVSILLLLPVSVSAQSLTALLQENQQVRSVEHITDLSSLPSGIATGAQAPDIDVYLFADLTESNFSGTVLTKNIPRLLQAYPQNVRVRYFHTVLPYRDTADFRNAIVTSTCLGREGKFWSNIQQLVDTQGKWNIPYAVDNETVYRSCLQEINAKSILDSMVKQGQENMQKFGITGIPTALIVPADNPTKGILISGAYPYSVYQEAVEYVQDISVKQNAITPIPSQKANNTFADILQTVLRFFQSLFHRS